MEKPNYPAWMTEQGKAYIESSLEHLEMLVRINSPSSQERSNRFIEVVLSLCNANDHLPEISKYSEVERTKIIREVVDSLDSTVASGITTNFQEKMDRIENYARVLGKELAECSSLIGAMPLYTYISTLDKPLKDLANTVSSLKQKQELGTDASIDQGKVHERNNFITLFALKMEEQLGKHDLELVREMANTIFHANVSGEKVNEIAARRDLLKKFLRLKSS